MKEKHTGSTSRKPTTDWKRLQSRTDRQVRKALDADPEARPTDVSFWTNAKLVLPKPKQTVTIRLDADLLEWFRKHKGYQTRINAVLRSYMKASRVEASR